VLLYQASGVTTICREWKGGNGAKKFWETLVWKSNAILLRSQLIRRTLSSFPAANIVVFPKKNLCCALFTFCTLATIRSSAKQNAKKHVAFCISFYLKTRFKNVVACTGKLKHPWNHHCVKQNGNHTNAISANNDRINTTFFSENA